MTKRGRKPRTDDRRTISTRIAATPEEEKEINMLYTTDEKRQAIMSWSDVRQLVKLARFILKDATITQHGYAVLDRGCDESLRDALAPFKDTISPTRYRVDS